MNGVLAAVTAVLAVVTEALAVVTGVQDMVFLHVVIGVLLVVAGSLPMVTEVPGGLLVVTEETIKMLAGEGMVTQGGKPPGPGHHLASSPKINRFFRERQSSKCWKPTCRWHRCS